MARSLFVFGAPLLLYLPRTLQMSWHAMAMFLLYGVSRSGSLASLFTSTSWYIVTDVLLLLLLVSTEGLVTLVNVHASLRSFENMLACLFVFTRLAPGIFNLAWRLIRVRQYFLILY